MAGVSILLARDIKEACRVAVEQGWTRIAAARFVSSEKDDIRLISNWSEVLGYPPGTKVFYEPGFEKIGPTKTDTDKERLASQIEAWDKLFAEIKNRNWKMIPLKEEEVAK